MAYCLLTGVTGLVGGYLLKQLMNHDPRVAVVVRPTRLESASQRVDNVMRCWEDLVGHCLPRPVVLSGELSRSKLGLDESSRTWISNNCDTILHNAASMRFVEDKKSGEPFRTNADGMKHVLDICRECGIRKFHHVSTAYICGLRTGRVLESELDVGQQNGNVYEESKLAAEKAVRAADFLEQLTIYRPASVVGDSRSGFTTSSHGFYLPLQLAHAIAEHVPVKMMGEQFFKMLELDGTEGKNFVPVDWLADAITHLFTHPEYHGKTYHLASHAAVTVRLIQETIQEAIEKYTDRRHARTPSEERWKEFETQYRKYMEIYRSHWRNDPTFDR
ncbi:MAG: SDR family oxidoreductase, partial [Pirellulales bacterium]